MKSNLPFAEILRPVANAALRDVRAPRLIRDAFALSLTGRLAAILSQCLYFEFSAGRTAVAAIWGSAKGSYAEFVRTARREGLESTLSEYKVATNAITILTSQARSGAEQLADHLSKDRRVIASLMPRRKFAGLHAVEAGLSDPHRDGRAVARLTFNDGEQVFYKPRSLAVDAAWREGLGAFNEGLRWPLRAPAVADREEYGWAEAIRVARDVTRGEADIFYWRYGALLAVAWLLDAVDLHRENIVICRADPVLVDLEGLLHPLGHREKRSLARTSIIPQPVESCDLSCLGESRPQRGPAMLQWKGVGTDRMKPAMMPVIFPASFHLPRVRGRLLPPIEAKDALLSGFSSALTLAVSRKDEIEAWRDRLAALARRRFERSSISYARILDSLAHPIHMRSDASWRRAVARLVGDRKTESRREEVRQLSRWDIPVFETREAPRTMPWDQIAAARRELARFMAAPSP